MTFVVEVILVLIAMWLGSLLRDARFGKLWDEWRGTEAEDPVMFIRRLLVLPVWRRAGKTLSIRIDLHKIVAADGADCFHTHPAWAIRIILWGGYLEEIFNPAPNGHWFARFAYWLPLTMGIVAPTFAHRIAHVLDKKYGSWSIWIRGPVVADVGLVGPGWARERAAPERN